MVRCVSLSCARDPERSQIPVPARAECTGTHFPMAQAPGARAGVIQAKTAASRQPSHTPASSQSSHRAVAKALVSSPPALRRYHRSTQLFCNSQSLRPLPFCTQKKAVALAIQPRGIQPPDDGSNPGHGVAKWFGLSCARGPSAVGVNGHSLGSSVSSVCVDAPEATQCIEHTILLTADHKDTSEPIMNPPGEPEATRCIEQASQY